MSRTQIIGPAATVGATAATLPVTGQPVFVLAAIGVGLVLAGGLLVRAGRTGQNPRA